MTEQTTRTQSHQLLGKASSPVASQQPGQCSSTALRPHQEKCLSSRRELCPALRPAKLHTSAWRKPEGKLCRRATRCTNRQQVLDSPGIPQTEHGLQLQSSMRANHCACRHCTPPQQPSAPPPTLPLVRDHPTSASCTSLREKGSLRER